MTVPFPGDVLRDRIKELGVTQQWFGDHASGLHWVTINRLIKGHEPINPQYALLLAKMFSTKGEYWMHLQADWDLEQHRKKLAQGTEHMAKKQAAAIARTKVFE